MSDSLFPDAAALAEVCRRHGIHRLSLFGSTVKGTARADSDVDLLVEFVPEARPSYFDLSAIEIELSALLGGRPVDVRTVAELSPFFRNEVVAQARAQYAAG